MSGLLRALGGLALVRNKLWLYNETIVVEGQSRPFADQYKEVSELIEALSEQFVQYQVRFIYNKSRPNN